MTATRTRHLVTVWNPSVADNAMDEHLRVLRSWGQKHDDGKIDRATAKLWRERIVGVGCAGLLAELAATRVKA